MYSELIGFFLLGMFLAHLKIESDLLRNTLINMELLSHMSLQELSQITVKV